MQKIYLDNNWKCARDAQDLLEALGSAREHIDFDQAAFQSLDDSAWMGVDLPHDLTIEDEFQVQKDISAAVGMPLSETSYYDAFSEKESFWYRKHFFLNDVFSSRRMILHFEGISPKCNVYLNETKIGSHESGSGRFSFDVSGMLRTGEDANLLAVQLEEEEKEVHRDRIKGYGIYDHIWLEALEYVDIPENGTAVITETDTKEIIHVRINIENTLKKKADRTVSLQVFDADGLEVADTVLKTSIAKETTTEICTDLSIKEPKLWNLQTPYLYTLLVRVMDMAAETVSLHRVPFGIRTITLDGENGLSLNGEKVLAHGVCLHPYHAGCGMGIPDSVKEYRLLRLKELGVNAVRFAGGQMSEAELTICDRLGILVFAEASIPENDSFDPDAVRSMVLQSRNHPSVYCYCLGQEAVNKPFSENGLAAFLKLREDILALDSSRLLSMTFGSWDSNFSRKSDTADIHRFDGLIEKLDLIDLHYHQFRIPAFLKAYPQKPFSLTESGVFRQKTGTYNIGAWEKCKSSAACGGFFLWTGFDYKNNSFEKAGPDIMAEDGMLDSCGFLKDKAYYYMSQWSDSPVVWTYPKWEDIEQMDRPTDVFACSNMDDVELFIGRKSLGKKKTPENGILCWENVSYLDEDFRCSGFRKRRKLVDHTDTFAGNPVSILLEPGSEDVEIRQGDVIVMNVTLLDRNGNLARNAGTRINLKVTGAGHFCGCGNGDPYDYSSEKESSKNAYHGKLQFLIKVTEPTGRIKITAKAANLVTRCTMEL